MKEIDQRKKIRNLWIRKKFKKVCKILGYIKHLIILVSTVTECVFISVFASLFGIPAGVPSSAVGMKICAITAMIKKSIIKKEEAW